MKAQTLDPAQAYADLFPAYVAELRQLGVHGIRRRERALEALTAQGFAVSGREEWKYGDPGAVAQGEFLPRAHLVQPLTEANPLPQTGTGLRLVFLNGRFQPVWSTPRNTLPPGVRLGPLAAAGDDSALGTVAKIGHAPLTALNSAFWQDGVRLQLGAGVQLRRTLELVFLTDERAAGSLVAPRNLVVAGQGSGVRIVERHLSPAGVHFLNAPVTEVVCGAGARIEHVKWVGEGDAALHYGSTHVRQDSDSRYFSGEFLLGGARLRRELHVDLAGGGASCDLSGLTLAGSGQFGDVRTRVRHAVPGCHTEELYKGIFLGEGRGVFDGLILVDRDAQQTRAYQTNRNLLLGEDAACTSIPRLEIYADDVKCSHGSTTGRLADEQLFYLRSRGFDEATARRLLSYAFATDVVERLTDPALREELTAAVHERLKDGSR